MSAGTQQKPSVKYNVTSNTYLVSLGWGCVYELTSEEFKGMYASMIEAYVDGLRDADGIPIEMKRGSGL